MTTNEPEPNQRQNRARARPHDPDRIDEYTEFVRYRRLARSRKHMRSMLLWIGVVIVVVAIAPAAAPDPTATEAAAWTGAVGMASGAVLGHFAYALFLLALPDHVNAKTIKAAIGGSHRE